MSIYRNRVIWAVMLFVLLLSSSYASQKSGQKEERISDLITKTFNAREIKNKFDTLLPYGIHKDGAYFKHSTSSGYMGSSQGAGALKPQEKEALESLAKKNGALSSEPEEYILNTYYSKGYAIKSKDQKITVVPKNSNKSPKITLQGGRAYYKNTQDQMYTAYLPLPSGMEEMYMIWADKGQRIINEIECKTGKIGVEGNGNLEIGGMELSKPVIFDSNGKRIEGKYSVGNIKDNKAFVEILFDKKGLRYPILIDPTWRAANNMNTERYWHTATLLPSGKVLVAGGIGVDNSYLTSCEIYDPSLGTWSSTGNLSAARYGHTATLLPNGKVLVTGGGGASGTVTSCEAYDPSIGIWIAAGNLGASRFYHTATLLPNGKVLVAGGFNGSTYTTSCEVYDPSLGTWSMTGSLSSGRYVHTATLLPNGKVLVAGGYNGSGYLSSCEVYSPSLGTWRTTGSLNTSRYIHTATLLPNGKVLVAGGSNSSTITSCEVYDPLIETWTTTGSLNTGRFYHTATLLPNGNVLVAGGHATSSQLTSCELYNTLLGTWSMTGDLSNGREMNTATLLPNGKVLVGGGGIASTPTTSCELYDPSLGTWAGTGSLSAARYDHSATLLPNGKVLVAGGYDGGYLSSCELYDPTLGTWTDTGSLHTSREVHTATLLSNGKVLVVGGYNGSVFLSSCEVYDPLLGTWANTGKLISGRYLHTSTLLPSGKVLVEGGYNGDYLTSCEVYDPSLGTWSSTGSLGTGRFYQSATLMLNGKVLVAGGFYGSSLTSCEVYDPSLGTWSSTGSLGTARDGHTATLLPSGKILAAGGEEPAILTSCELYDPSLGTWNPTGSLNAAREWNTATLLPNGKVLAIGGYGGSYLPSCELYDPSTGTWITTLSLSVERGYHTATLLPNGKVLVTAGLNGSNLISCELARYTEYDYTTYSNMRPSVTSVGGSTSFPLSLIPNTSYAIAGSGFKGTSESSGGNYQSSSTNYPRVYLQFADSGGYSYASPSGNLLDRSSSVFPMTSTQWQGADTSISFTTPNDLPEGYYLLSIQANAAPSDAKMVYYNTNGSGTTYTLSAEAVGNNGTVEPYGVVTVGDGTNRTFIVTANSGYYIRDIKVDGNSITAALGSSYAYTFEAVAANHTIQASFEVSGRKVWDGGGITNYWKDPNNWTGNATPDATDTATFDSTSQKVCTMDASVNIANVFISSAYTGKISQKASLTVAGSFTQEGLGTFECTSPQTIAFTSESFSISDNRGRFLRFTGAGTSGNPYLIYDVYGLQSMNQYLGDTNVNFKLSQNIDATITSHWNGEAGFVPVGNVQVYFMGNLYGGSKTVSGLFINRQYTDYVGLFGLTYLSTIQEIGIVSCNVTGRSYVGGLDGYASSTSISNSYETGLVKCVSYGGGLAGINFNSTTSRCYSTGSFSNNLSAGGLVGYNWGSTINDSYATGNVGGVVDVGGLTGYNTASAIINSYSTGGVSGNTDLGGLVGYNTSSTVTNSYYDGTTSGQSDNVGKGLPETTLQMMNKNTFTNWDWDNVWGIKNGQSYPTLQWQGHIWYGGAGNNWSTGGNWNKGTAPGISDMVYFNSSSTTDATANSSFSGSIAGLSIGAGYASIITLGKDLTIGNDLYQNAGTLNCSSYTMTISGGISHEAGTFTDGTGTVIFNDATRISTIEGNTTFKNLTCATAGKILSFEALQITTAEGALTLTGSAGNLIKLRSTGDGTQWKINPSGTRSVNYVDVKDSNNINALVIDPANSTNSGNNTNWFTQPPSAPTNFVSTSESTAGLHYTWTDSSTNEAGFRILDAANVTMARAASGETSTSESGLAANTQYTRKVEAYNSAGAATSDSVSRYTSVESSAGATWEGISDTSITIHSSNAPSNLSSGLSGLYFENVTKETNSGWIQTNTWASSGLTASTAYNFRITARNGDGVIMSTRDAGSMTTHAPTTPEAPSNFRSVSSSVGSLNYFWTDNSTSEAGFRILDNSNNIKVLVAANSTSTSESGLNVNTQYSRKVQAYNSSGSATSDVVSKYTSIEASTGGTFEGGISSMAITVHSINEPTRLATGESGILFNNTTNSSDSGWLKTNTWTQTGLATNAAYAYTITAKNGDGIITTTADAGTKYTPIEPARGISWEGITSRSITAHASNEPTNLNPGSSGIYFEITDPVAKNSGWIKTNTWQNSGLEPSTAYTFKAVTRNGDGVLTATVESVQSTTPPPPTPEAPSNVAAITESTGQIGYTWTDASTSESGFRVLDGSDNVKASVAAGSTSASESGLSTNTQYTRKIQAYNETGAATSETILRYTSIEAASAMTLEGLTTTCMTVHASQEPSNLATGESGILFRNITNSTDSTWIKSNAWNMTGLATNQAYSIKITTKNGDGLISSTYDAASKYTAIESATGASWEGITTTNITIHSLNEPSNLSSGSSGIYFQNISEGTNSGWISSNNWSSSSLSANTAYSFRITVRNGDGVMSSTLEAGSKRTLPIGPASIPEADLYSNITTSKIAANWKANGNPDGTQYYCENTVSGNNSGWITLLKWTDSGLAASTMYSFRVKAKNSLGVQTLWTDLGMQETKGFSAFSSIKENGVNLFNGDIIKNKPALEIRAESVSDISVQTFKIWIDGVQINDAATSAAGYDSLSASGKDITFYYAPKTALTTGSHKIKFEVYDDEGTIFQEQRLDLNVKDEKGITGAVLPYPNPYDPSKSSGKITYTLNTDTGVTVFLFDTAGKLVWKNDYPAGGSGGKAGYNEVVWDGKDLGGFILPNDVYLLRIIEKGTGNVLGKSKIVILRSSAARPDMNFFAGITGLCLFGFIGVGGIILKRFHK